MTRTLLIYLLPLLAASAPSVRAQGDFDDPFPPHHVAGNIYYVGTKGLANYLITTPQGHFLINSSFERTVPSIKANVEKMGFRFADIKYLLASHAHDDHLGGHALVKKMTGARVLIMHGDEDIVENGGKGDFQYEATMRYPGCKVDRILSNGDKVSLGGVTLIAYHTPGHTKGCTTWTLKTSEKGRDLNVVIVGSPNVNTGYQLVGNTKYPEIAEDFAKTFRVLKSLACDVFLGAHGSYYGMEAKYPKIGKGENPFIDPAGYTAYVADREKAYLTELERQRKSPPRK